MGVGGQGGGVCWWAMWRCVGVGGQGGGVWVLVGRVEVCGCVVYCPLPSPEEGLPCVG